MYKDNICHKFFYPKNIAVIGVSPKETNMGKNIVQNLLAFGYAGEVLSVGPKEGIVFGQRIYQSLDQIDHNIDMAVILTPAHTIPSILEECGKKGVSRVVIESGGFSEMGQDRAPLESACIDSAEKYGIRFIGPNGIGIVSMESGIATPFMPIRYDLTFGKVSILTQSGGVGLSYLNFMTEENIGVNKFVSMGNKLNISENDLLAYLIEDPGTEIILVYLEGFKNARGFTEVAARSEKPILVHKSNRFKTSANIAQSHTTALSTDDILVDYALEQAGCVRVNSLAEAVDYIKILTLPPTKGKRLAIVTRSGGHAVIAADVCGRYGFEFPAFPEDFIKKIEGRVRANVIRLQNPLDLGDLFELPFYEYIIEEMLKHDDIDAILLGHGYREGYEQADSRKLIDRIRDFMDKYKKPVAAVIITESKEMAYLKKNAKIPVFSAPENPIKALHLSNRWTLRNRSAFVQEPIDIELDHAKEIISNASDRGFLHLSESFDLLEVSGFDIPKYFLANTADKAVDALRSINQPVVMKINRPHISHKSDKGLVRINLNSPDDIRVAFNEFQQKISNKEIEVLIQPMIFEGREVILGGRRDEAFGPVIMFGLGGVFVEVIEDISWRLAPIDIHEADSMIRGIKGYKVLEGIRGEGPYDIDALKGLLVKLSGLLVEFPEIREIDINPVKVAGAGHGANVLDARVVLG